MGFIMDGLDAEAYDRTYTDRQLLGRIVHYFKPKFALMVQSLSWLYSMRCLDTAFPLLISHSIDTLVGTQAVQTAIWLVGFILLSGMLSWTCNLFRQRFSAQCGW